MERFSARKGPRRKNVPGRFVVELMAMGTFSGIALIRLWYTFGESPEFADIVGCDKRSWHAWLPALSAGLGSRTLS